MTGLIRSSKNNDIWPLEWFPAGVHECDSIDGSNKIGRGISLFCLLEKNGTRIAMRHLLSWDNSDEHLQWCTMYMNRREHTHIHTVWYGMRDWIGVSTRANGYRYECIHTHRIAWLGR